MAIINCRICFLFILFFSVLNSTAQLSRLDSLKNNIVIATSETSRLKATLEFCDGWESFTPDTLYEYALMAKQLAVNERNKEAILLSDYYLAAYLFQKNKVDTALKAIDNI